MAEIEAACAQAADGLEPFADEDADAEFRKHLVTVLTKRAVATADVSPRSQRHSNTLREGWIFGSAPLVASNGKSRTP
ncbi:MAG: hypothetical protein CL523_04625 [Actinomycetales bacterium]|nr:MAG: hypothetical protein CL523_04625 [Actinomycetales bacterium]